MKVRISSDHNSLEIDLGTITSEDLDLAFNGVINAVALLEAQGYRDGGEIHAGLSLAGTVIEAFRKVVSKHEEEEDFGDWADNDTDREAER